MLSRIPWSDLLVKDVMELIELRMHPRKIMNNNKCMSYITQKLRGYEESISCPCEAFSNAIFACSIFLATLKPLAKAESQITQNKLLINHQ